MVFLELAAQAVRGFSPSIRVALKSGYVALKSPGDLPAPLASLVVALAFPDGRGGDAAFLAPGSKSGRVGLSLQANDGNVFRVVRDLGGAGGLHKLNRDTQQFDVITQEASELSQWLRSSTGFPVRSVWEQLFALTGPQLPSRRPKGGLKGPNGRGEQGSPPDKAGSPDARAMLQSQWAMEVGSGSEATRLVALEEELKTAKHAADIQFKMDGLNAEIFELESKQKAWGELAQKVADAREELATFSVQTKGMPEDIVARAKRYPEDRKRYEEQIGRVRLERAKAADRAPSRPDPLWKNREFLGATVLGVVLFFGAMFLDGGLRYLALAAMVPLSISALLALRFIEELQTVDRQSGKGEIIDLQEKRINDEFQMATLVVQNAFQAVNALSLDDFLVVMGKKDQLAATVAQLDAELSEVQRQPEFASIAKRVVEKRTEHDALNEELLAMSGGYVREVREIERDIARIKQPVLATKQSATAGFTAVNTGPIETFDDPMPALMLLATDVFATDVSSVWSVLHDRAVQYLSALTDRRYHELSIDKEGHVTVEAPGRSLSAKDLPGRDLDLIYLALRLTLIEKASAQQKVPVVIEDTFNTVLDATKQPLFGRMLRHLGTLTQVLHVTGAGQSAALADTPVTI